MWVLLVIAGVGAGAAAAQVSPATGVEFASWCDEGVSQDSALASGTLAFATRLAELGPRPAAGEGEARARAAVVSELEAIGLEVSTESFDYQSFVLEKTTLQLGGTPVEPVKIGLDPFSNTLAFTGEAVVVTDPAQAGPEITGRIVVTNHPFMQLMISEMRSGGRDHRRARRPRDVRGRWQPRGIARGGRQTRRPEVCQRGRPVRGETHLRSGDSRDLAHRRLPGQPGGQRQRNRARPHDRARPRLRRICGSTRSLDRLCRVRRGRKRRDRLAGLCPEPRRRTRRGSQRSSTSIPSAGPWDR